MKLLTILRHAKSSWEEQHLADFDRPLNDRGRKAARRVGRELKRRGMHFDHCVASAAARVRETLDELIDAYGQPGFDIRFEPRIHEATVATLTDVIRGLPDSANAALLVGHNPGLQNLILTLARDGASRDPVAQKFPTAGLAQIELTARNWAEVVAGTGEIALLIFPKELD